MDKKISIPFQREMINMQIFKLGWNIFNIIL